MIFNIIAASLILMAIVLLTAYAVRLVFKYRRSIDATAAALLCVGFALNTWSAFMLIGVLARGAA